jgi:hypothetical protein
VRSERAFKQYTSTSIPCLITALLRGVDTPSPFPAQSAGIVLLPIFGHLGQLSLIRFQPLRNPIFQCQLASFGTIINSNHYNTIRKNGTKVKGLLDFISQFPHFLNHPSLPPPNLLFPPFNLQHLFPLSFLPPSFPFLGPMIYFLFFPVVLMVGFVGDLGWCLRLRLRGEG